MSDESKEEPAEQGEGRSDNSVAAGKSGSSTGLGGGGPLGAPWISLEGLLAEAGLGRSLARRYLERPLRPLRSTLELLEGSVASVESSKGRGGGESEAIATWLRLRLTRMQ